MAVRADVWITKYKGKRGTTYNVRWHDPIERTAAGMAVMRSESCGPDRKAAEAFRAVVYSDLMNGTFRSVRRIAWPAFVTEHVDSLACESNRASVGFTLTEFGDVCRPETPAGVSYGMVEKFVKRLRERAGRNATADAANVDEHGEPTKPRKPLSGNTINRKLRELKAALNKAIARGYAKTNPVAEHGMVKAERKAVRALDDGEKHKLLDACTDPQWRLFVHAALVTGCRRSELTGLTWERVDLNGGTFTVTKTKAKRDRVCVLDPEGARRLLSRWADVPKMIASNRKVAQHPHMFTTAQGGPWTNNVNREFARILAQAGIGRCTIHDLRRTVGTTMAELDINQRVTQETLGHADIATTGAYYQGVTLRKRRQVAAALAATMVG